ncbi:MAG TPA: toll/interleukin-1 receptor domain-containing protein, partial [bacterium]
MAKVFISHSWKDNEIARKIAQYLKHDRVDIWIDYARIKPGEGLPHRISQALEWCDTLVLIWSKGAVDSYYVGLEWQAALDMQKKIIFCLTDDAKRPAILRGFLYIDFKNFSTGYGQLIDALELKREQAPEQPSEPTEKIQDYSAPGKQKELKPKSAEAPTRIKTLNEKKNIIKITSLFVAILIIVFGGIYFLRSIISRNSQNKEKVAAQQAAQDSLKIYWEKWQSEMNTSYQQAQQRDSNATLDASFKVQTWQDFLTKYARDNPDSRRDDSLRTKANDRKIYWRNQATQDSVKAAEKARREQWQVEMDKSYERALRQDSYTSLTAANKEKIWQDFLNKYAEDNPFTGKDNDQRSNATRRRNYWRNLPPPIAKPPTEKTVKGMMLVLIHGGTFDMGDTFGDGDADE